MNKKVIEETLWKMIDETEVLLTAQGTPEQKSYGEGYYHGCLDTVKVIIELMNDN